MTPSAPPTLPTPEGFRKWLIDSVERVGVTPSALSLSVGLSKNTVARIMQPDAGLTLRTARLLQVELSRLAGEKGVKLLAEAPE